MVKTIRLSDESHRKLVRLQGLIQAETEETTSMDFVVDILATHYENSGKKKSKK